MTDAELFLKAMQEMKVKDQKKQARDHVAPPEPEDDKDLELFLSAIDEAAPTDSEGEGPEPRQISCPDPERLKLVRNREIDVHDSLDLHGSTAEEARGKLIRFVNDHAERGTRCVLIITGKGKNSRAKSVLKPMVVQWIHRQGRAYIKSWGIAPRLQGGEGAIVLYLRKRGGC